MKETSYFRPTPQPMISPDKTGNDSKPATEPVTMTTDEKKILDAVFIGFTIGAAFAGLCFGLLRT